MPNFVPDRLTKNLAFVLKQPCSRSLWRRLFILTFISVCFYVGMEWVFYVTKPSFMDTISWWEKFSVLAISILMLLIPSYLVLGLCFVLQTWIPGLKKTGWIFLPAVLVPTSFFSITSLLLLDNFTYTLFKWGIVTTNGFLRALYGFGFVCIFCGWLIYQAGLVKDDLEPGRDGNLRGRALVALVISGLLVVIAIPQIKMEQSALNLSSQAVDGDLPNILLISSDGLTADHMSVYGYERNTTPFLNELGKQSLVAENAFTNSSKTSGSLVSVYTGKLPITTRMLFPPDTLKGVDSYQHLPGILKSMGYYSIQISTPFYADANSQGVMNGFDIANSQLPVTNSFYQVAGYIPFENVKYFMPTIAVRISERLLHIFFIHDMVNPYTEVTTQQVDFSDVERVKEIRDLIATVDQPLFLHAHLLATHGDYYSPREQQFSAGRQQTVSWETDFFDDAVLDFDSSMAEIVEQLKLSGKYENTIIVVFSDHYQQWVSDMRLPMIIHFPADANSGVIYQNTQNLDIAPTILDYLGIDIPTWMEGESLLRMTDNPDPGRLIYSFGPAYTTINDNNLAVSDTEKIGAPFYQFGFIQAVVCDTYYKLDLRHRRWVIGQVYNYSDHGLCVDMPSADSVKAEIIQKMADSHFDINRLTKRPIEEITPSPYPHSIPE